MHKSRLAGMIIDCDTDDLDAAGAFWAQALGYGVKPSTHPEDDGYVTLDTGAEDLHVEVQRVSHDSRVHLDIEADDIEAEVRRLERLGAKRVEQVKRWWVMEAPSGQRFCVVPAEGTAFEDRANRWSE